MFTFERFPSASPLDVRQRAVPVTIGDGLVALPPAG